MTNPITPKTLVALDEEAWNELAELGAPVADPTQNTAVGIAPIQSWSETDPILPDLGNVDNKILGAAGLSNTILVSTETKEILAAITVNVGANGNWYVGPTDTGIKAEGTDPLKLLRPPGTYIMGTQSWDNSTRMLTISAGTGYCVFASGSTDIHQLITTTGGVVNVTAGTQALCLDYQGNLVELTDSSDVRIGATLAPIAYWDVTSGDYSIAKTIPELLYSLTRFDVEQGEILAEMNRLLAETTTQAGIATGAATDAIAAAAAANLSQTSAAQSATESEASNQASATKAGEAAASATTAGQEKDAAIAAANTATTKAGEATGSATIAADAAVLSEQARDAAQAAESGAAQDAATATAAASTATTQAGIATTAANSTAADVITATAEADRAKAEADRAEQITGIDTVEDAIKLAADEVTGLLTESAARALQARNQEYYAASGMVHAGKQYNNGSNELPINEGMNTILAYPNLLAWGRGDTYSPQGTSKTWFPVHHIAGAVFNIINLNRVGTIRNEIALPEAEDGTRIYDSTGDARGSGQASLALKVDVDPKYGDVAADTNEAVARAFEGVFKNGDFRLGDNGDWQDVTADVTITTGKLVCNGANAASIYTKNAALQSFKAGVTYEATIYIESITSGAAFVIQQGGGVTSPYYTEVGEHKFLFTPSVDIAMHPVALQPNTAITVTSVIYKPVTEQVVTHPVDGIFLEYFEEELVDPNRREIFECLQSLSATFGTTSVPTELSTRPNSYFDMYVGQSADPDATNNEYRCVVWENLTPPQRREVTAYLKERLFKGITGNMVNGRFRCRTVRGAGNGDWSQINSAEQNALRFQSNGFSYVKAQGASNSVDAFGDGVDGYYSADRSDQWKPDWFNGKGIFVAGNNTSQGSTGIAYQGRCFMYLVGTVPRANKGAYHPDLNPWGVERVANTLGSDYGGFWSASDVLELTTEAQCFNPQYLPTNRYGEIGGQGTSGHPGGIFYDGIEAGGLNGIIDRRLPAEEDASGEEASKVEAKVENGTYRGMEKLVWTQVVKSTTTSSTTNAYIQLPESEQPDLLSIGSVVFVKAGGANAYNKRTVTSISSTAIGVNENTSKDALATLVFEMKTNLSVSGEFNTQMIVGDPANILLTDALKDGWLGTWSTTIPDNTTKDFPLSRKSLETSISGLNTSDNGATWDTSTFSSFDSTRNNLNFTYATGVILIANYKAFAKPTKSSTNKPVLNDKKGLMPVLATSQHIVATGAALAESTLGLILKGDGGDSQYKTLNLKSFVIGSISPVKGMPPPWANYMPEHEELTLSAPTNDSPAFKVLPYQISNNGQASIGYQANELTYDDSQTVYPLAGSNAAWTVDQYVLITSGEFRGFYQVVKSGAVLTAVQDYGKGLDGHIYHRTEREMYFRSVDMTTIAWGDDGTIKVTADDRDSFVDLNGNTNISVVHELALPYGWTKNRARTGVQVEGVDL